MSLEMIDRKRQQSKSEAETSGRNEMFGSHTSPARFYTTLCCDLAEGGDDNLLILFSMS